MYSFGEKGEGGAAYRVPVLAVAMSFLLYVKSISGLHAEHLILDIMDR